MERSLTATTGLPRTELVVTAGTSDGAVAAAVTTLSTSCDVREAELRPPDGDTSTQRT